MSEKRKPLLIIMLRYQGKKESNKVEIFDASLWKGSSRPRCFGDGQRYRIRVNGKWFDLPGGLRYAGILLYELRDIFWRSVKRALKEQLKR
jgi:hypothetical protein